MPALPSLQVTAGEHDRRDCPVWLDPPAGLPDGPLWLAAPDRRTPLQRVGDRLVFILDELPRGASRRYRVEAGPAPAAGVRVVERPGALEISVHGAAFTTYHIDPSGVRPYFFPLLGPTGVPMTRSFPMVTGVPGESTDHPHHRSLYVAFGEVNGVDVWAEPPHPNTGRIVHRSWDEIADGPAAALLRERLQWIDGKEVPLLDERREVVVYAARGIRLLEISIALTPSRVAVLFGDTKEGGPLALRVNSAIEGRRGGLIENAYGGRREAETWGKRAPWVDYAGVIDGQTVGVAIMDHPSSFRHPTYWHVRDYGLFAANPFGISQFTGDPGRRGDVILTPGQTLTFRYRVCLHTGDAASGRIADRYHDFANPPAATWE
jgi:hypothetical protein